MTSAGGPPKYPSWRADRRPTFDGGVDRSAEFGIASRRAWVVAPGWAWALAFALLPGWRAWRWYRPRKLRGGPAFEVVMREG